MKVFYLPKEIMMKIFYLPLVPPRRFGAVFVSTVNSLKHKQRITYDVYTKEIKLQKIGNVKVFDDIYYISIEDFKSVPHLKDFRPEGPCVELGYNKQLKRYIFIATHKGK